MNLRVLINITLVLCHISATHLFGDVVHLRDGATSIEGTVLRFDDSGVTILPSINAERIVPWDRIRDIESRNSDEELKSYLKLATKLWRARSRVERGDTILAEPLFNELFDKYVGQTHETSLVVAEGFLRCLLARGANDAALIPALEVARLRRAQISTVSYATLTPVIDERTSLCTQLPPAWSQSPSLDELRARLEDYETNGDQVIASIATLYGHAIRQQLNDDDSDELTKEPSDHPGVNFLRSLLELNSPHVDRRERTRTSIVRQFNELPGWAEAWARYFYGCSLLSEEDSTSRERGMVSLAHVPARFETIQPYLYGLAIAKLSDGLSKAGDHDAARALLDELQEMYPSHPAIAGQPG